jgi:hypothetical protein
MKTLLLIESSWIDRVPQPSSYLQDWLEEGTIYGGNGSGGGSRFLKGGGGEEQWLHKFMLYNHGVDKLDMQLICRQILVVKQNK